MKIKKQTKFLALILTIFLGIQTGLATGTEEVLDDPQTETEEETVTEEDDNYDEDDDEDEDDTEDTKEEDDTKTPQIPEKFNDVDKGHTNYIAISALREQGIIGGYSDGNFRPNQNINRAEALKMITLATKVFTEEDIENTEYENEEKPFTDTPLDKWYTKYLIPAKERKIINGHPDGRFAPEENVKLGEALKILFESYSHFNLEDTLETLYEDTPKNSWFSKYTSYGGSKGIINIYTSNTVNPGQELTRGYLAEIIYRAMLHQEEYHFGKATWYGAALHGRNTASGEVFDKNELTGAHKTLPFNTVVEVTNLANGKSIQIRITDRGPYGPGRVLDLSSSAFSEIASLGTGVINVQYKIISST